MASSISVGATRAKGWAFTRYCRIEKPILESFKGSRHLPRAPRKRGGKAKKSGLSHEQIPVIVVRDRYGATTDSVLQKVTEETVGAVLKLVLDKNALTEHPFIGHWLKLKTLNTMH